MYSSVQFSSVTQSCLTLCDPMNRSTPGLPVLHQLPEFTQTHVYQVGDAIQPSHPLSSPSPPTPNPSKHQSLFQWVSSLHQVAKVSKEHSGLISFRMDWLDLIAVQGSLLQHHSSKASVLWHSAFFIVQLSHPYMTTGKTIALTRWTFVGKIMSLLFNMLSRLVITFLPRSKRFLISWLQWPSAVIFEPPKKKSATVSTVSGNYILWWYLPAVSFTNTNRCLKNKRNTPNLLRYTFILKQNKCEAHKIISKDKFTMFAMRKWST